MIEQYRDFHHHMIEIIDYEQILEIHVLMLMILMIKL